ncbi:MAG: serine--tRNA ligase, partial [Spirochaetales bacterium]|nr:serine--tRNA ligase [Spirochaetales bacterium]
MIDVKELRTRKDEIAENIKNRYMNVDLEAIIKHQEERGALLAEVEALRAKRNETAAKMKQKLDNETRQLYIAEGKAIKEELAEKEAKLTEIEAIFNEEIRTIPNYASPEAPIGKEDKDNLAVKFFGEPKKFAFQPKDHVQLGEELNILDFDAGAKVSGQKFYYIKNKLVILQMALERYAMDVVIKHGFTPFITPDIAKEEVLHGIGFNPRGAESNIYTLEGTGTCLVGTAEITLGGYYQNSILEKKDLPIKMTGLSHCFRREAGGAGQYSKGLYRVHQFSKLEMFIYCLPEESEAFHKEILAIEEEIFQGLNIPYRVVDTATGDLGAPAYRKFDIEAWMPGRGDEGEYGEVTSTSNCTDYQAR